MKRVTAILALFAIVGMAFAAGCDSGTTTPPEGGAEAGKAADGAKMAPADGAKAPAGAEAAPPGPK